MTWASDSPGATVKVVDLAPAVFRYKPYAPLRDDEALFRAVRVVDDGFAVARGDGDDLDMASTTISELAQQAMTPADFGASIRRNGYTLDSVAAELCIGRRLAACCAKDREVPRYIALACRFLDRTVPSQPALLPGNKPDHVETLARMAAADNEAFTVEDAEAAVGARDAVEEAFGAIRAAIRTG